MGLARHYFTLLHLNKTAGMTCDVTSAKLQESLRLPWITTVVWIARVVLHRRLLVFYKWSFYNLSHGGWYSKCNSFIILDRTKYLSFYSLKNTSLRRSSYAISAWQQAWIKHVKLLLYVFWGGELVKSLLGYVMKYFGVFNLPPHTGFNCRCGRHFLRSLPHR